MNPHVTDIPDGPGFLVLVLIPPVVVGPGVSFSCEHRRDSKEEESFVVNFSAGSPGLLLCILDHINILGNTLYFEVIALHFIMQHKEVEGVATCEPLLEVDEKCLWRDVGVNFSISQSSCTHVSLTTVRMNCAISRHAVSFVPLPARLDLCAASVHVRTTAL